MVSKSLTSPAKPLKQLKSRPMKPKFGPQRNSSFCMVSILLSGDTEVNPGPCQVNYPCLVCQKPAKMAKLRQNCLQCDECQGWYHIECMNMPTEVYQANANSSLSWICCHCGLPNVSPSLFRTLSVSSIALSNSFSTALTTLSQTIRLVQLFAN